MDLRSMCSLLSYEEVRSCGAEPCWTRWSV